MFSSYGFILIFFLGGGEGVLFSWLTILFENIKNNIKSFSPFDKKFTYFLKTLELRATITE
jgi:hypothetical protein